MLSTVKYLKGLVTLAKMVGPGPFPNLYTIYNIYEIHKDQAKNEGARAVTSIWYPVAMATKVFKRSA